MRRVYYIVIIVVILFVLMDLGFIWKNVVFTLLPPSYQQKQYDRTNIDSQDSVKLPPDTINIPSLGIIVPLKYVEEKSESAFQKALQDGVVHYPGTAMPGQFGNMYVFGHSSDYLFTPGSYKTAFALLPRIKKAAEIIVVDNAGKQFLYTVTDSFVAEANRTDLLDQHNNDKRQLTLQTSWPLGTAWKRYIVIAEIKN